MKIFSAHFGLLARCRMATAALFGLGAFALLWNGLGVSGLFPAPGVAVAESSSAPHREAPISVLPQERAALLQSTVDSVALSLGSVLAAQPSAPGALTDRAAKRQASLSGVLSELTFSLGGEVYFTAWEGTRMVHSPLVPDASDMDFADALDERGSAFVQRMEALAAGGGGFLQVTLPRQMAGRPAPGPREQSRTDHGGALREGPSASVEGHRAGDGASGITAAAIGGDMGVARERARDGGRGAPSDAAARVVRGAVDATSRYPDEIAEGLSLEPDSCPVGAGRACTGGHARPAPAPRIDSAPVEQVVYVRGIPKSDWHIAAFMPLEPQSASGEGFSSLWLADATRVDGERQGLLRKGLCLSGFSLAGLAGLMLVPGNGRGRGDRPFRNAFHQ